MGESTLKKTSLWKLSWDNPGNNKGSKRVLTVGMKKEVMKLKDVSDLKVTGRI